MLLVPVALFFLGGASTIVQSDDEKVMLVAVPVDADSGEEPEDDEFGAESQDDDFGGEMKDDDFGGEPEDDDFGSESKDDDFGGEMKDDNFGAESEDDDFGMPKKEGDEKAINKLHLLFQDDLVVKRNDEEEKKPEKEKVYASAAEAHLTFLKALETEKRFPSAATCGACHPDHYREWSVSAHAYAQLSPVFNTMHAEIVSRTAGTNGDFCIRCHTQVGMQRDEPLFTSNLKRHPASIEGITCIVCHRVEKNYGKVSGRTHIEKGDIFSPVYGPAGNKILMETLQQEEFSRLNTDPSKEGTDVHADVKKFDPIAKSGFCGSCHDVNLYNGFRLEEAFTQFKNSPAADKEQSCHDCHMGKIPGAVAPGADKIADPHSFDSINYDRGPGARVGGEVWAEKDKEETGIYGLPTKPRKRTNHMFAGPDYSIVHPAIFPHSEPLRQKMWDVEREVPGTGKTERVGMKHLITFKWEEGWGNPKSWFEKNIAKNPELEEDMPWPWDDPIVRQDMRKELNNSFRLLNEIDKQRHQILRRALQFEDFKVTQNDAKGIEFALEVRNNTDGHGVPTGFDAERLMFLQVTVNDRHGRTVFASGDRDPNGDVRDLHSAFVHHRAEKSGAWLASSGWKEEVGLKLQPEDKYWVLDKQLFSLQSKFLTRNHRGGEREQILAVNHSVDPLPYIRPDTRAGILVGRPAAARKQAKGIPPLDSRWAKYKIDKDKLTGAAPYTVNFKFICQMVPVNLIKDISDQGFDYNLSPREVGKRVVYGHPTSGSSSDSVRRGGALTIWDKTVVLGEAPYETNFRPSESEVMAAPNPPFPYLDPDTFGGLEGGGLVPYVPPEELPSGGNSDSTKPNPLLPKPEVIGDPNEDDSFE